MLTFYPCKHKGDHGQTKKNHHGTSLCSQQHAGLEGQPRRWLQKRIGQTLLSEESQNESMRKEIFISKLLRVVDMTGEVDLEPENQGS